MVSNGNQTPTEGDNDSVTINEVFGNNDDWFELDLSVFTIDELERLESLIAVIVAVRRSRGV